tara:strand:- start:638 stop:2362 length:1725 start_codon:yes stop_codon:yes gene_type:complete
MPFIGPKPADTVLDTTLIEDGTITKSKLATDAKTNITDDGTEGTKVALGTTGQRGSTTGQFRYNSTTNKFEGRNSNGDFVSLEQTPVISSIDDTEVDSAGGGNQTIVITGSGFSTGDVVSFVGTSASFNASTTTIDSSTQITAVAPKSSFLNAQEPYGVKVTTAGGLSGILENQINVDNNPTWSTAAGSLGTVYDSVRSTASLSATATDADSDTIVYSVQSGSLPAGASLNSSTGAITGFSAVGSDTTSSFTLRATANSKTADRAFSIIVKAPVTTAYAYTGSLQTFSVPSGVTSIQAKVWGAAGAGHNEYYSQSGGAGGFGIGTINVTGISSLNIVVGQGGQDRNTGGGVGSSNKLATYGHLVAASTGENGGWGNVAGTGGGLSGIFNGAVTSQSNAIAIAGGGGAAGSVSGEGLSVGQGGYGGGFNQNGGSGGVNSSASHGRPGTTSAGGDNGTVHFTRGSASGYTTANGGALHGGHGNTQTNGSSEGGGGGSGYFGGGAGTHGSGGGTWASGAGGSGYANTSLVSNITAANAGSAGATNSTATSDSNWASGIGVPVAGDNDGGNGRVVIIY